MKLIIAEKPSVAKDIARVVGATTRENGYYKGNGYIVSNFLGHLVELAAPEKYDEKYAKWNIADLPIIPNPFQYCPQEDKASALAAINKLMKSPEVDSIICATDAGREGEVIFRYVYDYLGCNKPYQRLWISSLTDESIKNGMANLVPGKENMFQAGAARAQVDWIVGMNLSRLYSIYFQKGMPVGRVQTATLNMIVQRDKEIANFVKKPYWKVLLPNGAEWFNGDKSSLDTQAEAQKIQNSCSNKTVTVTSAEKKREKENRPLLYSLTSLQIEANDSLDFSAAKTLLVMQSLYEKKLLTYPRTESNYLTEDMRSEVPLIIKLLEFYDAERVQHFEKVGLNLDSRVFDNNKVSDHHAIIPTKEIGNSEKMELTEDERAILDMVIKRFFLAFEQIYEYDETHFVFTIDNDTFRLTTQVPVNLGWKAYTSTSTASEAPKFNYSIGDSFQVGLLEIKSGETKPAKPFTESSLLKCMENVDRLIEDKELSKYVKARGLGTTATRAMIIERIILLQYVKRVGKKLIATEKGIFLIEHIPDMIKSVEMTANMESMLVAVEEGRENPENVLKAAIALVNKVISDESGKIHDKIPQEEKEVIGLCPKCSGKVYEGKSAYYCENYKAEKPCTFTIWKNSDFFTQKKKQLTTTIVKKLLKDKKALLSGCYSEKSGKTYDAYITLSDYTDKQGAIRTGFKVLEFKNNIKKDVKK